MWHPFTGCQTCLNFFFPGICKGTSNFDHNLEVSFNLERAPLKASRKHKAKKRQEKMGMVQGSPMPAHEKKGKKTRGSLNPDC
jgi:hypothetical protein